MIDSLQAKKPNLITTIKEVKFKAYLIIYQCFIRMGPYNKTRF